MDTVTDVLAFAAEHADYWTEFLSSKADYGDVVSGDELKALEAARLHIEKAIYDLLVECGAKLAVKLSDHGVISKSFRRGAALKHRRVWVPAPNGFGDRMYGFDFAFSESGDSIVLRGSLVVKVRLKDRFAQKLAEKAVSFENDGAYSSCQAYRLKEAPVSP
jgi:hypothetical protein